jgi:drug/metabolite transporter (DMT)-like permease
MQLSVQLSAAQYAYLAVSGVIGLVLGDTFLFRAFKDIGARVSMLVMSLVPAVSALLAYFFLAESMTPIALVGMSVTIAGITLVVLEKHDEETTRHRVTGAGLLFAFLAAVGQAVGLIFAKKAFLLGDIHGFVATFIRILISVLVITPVAVISGRYRKPVAVFSKDRKALLYTIIGSILGPYLGITFSLIAIQHTKVAIASTIMAMPPIIMLPLVRYFYKETLTWKRVLGAFIAVGGVALLFLR